MLLAVFPPTIKRKISVIRPVVMQNKSQELPISKNRCFREERQFCGFLTSLICAERAEFTLHLEAHTSPTNEAWVLGCRRTKRTSLPYFCKKDSTRAVVKMWVSNRSQLANCSRYTIEFTQHLFAMARLTKYVIFGFIGGQEGG